MGLVGCKAKISDKSIQSISIAEVRRVVEEVQKGNGRLALLVDPRTPDEYAAGHLPGSLNIGLGQVNPDAGKPRALEGYRYLIVYGEDPIDPPAVGMTKRLLQTGFRGVRLYRGGLSEWRAYGFPIEPDDAGTDDGAGDGSADGTSP
jgi:rhodanese-related sulfurtransferase